MLIKNTAQFTANPNTESALKWIGSHISPWQAVIGMSTLAGIGSGWAALFRHSSIPSPLWAAFSMMLVTFAGWYAWSFFTFLTDHLVFRGHSDWYSIRHAFAQAYMLQGLSFLVFTHPLGTLWSGVAAYLTIFAWGIVGPRQLGMRTWQAIVSATIGMLMWLACLVVLLFALQQNGVYLGIGAFLV